LHPGMSGRRTGTGREKKGGSHKCRLDIRPDFGENRTGTYVLPKAPRSRSSKGICAGLIFRFASAKPKNFA
jgi:hypothetical protein